jgi:Hydrogenase/urease nickel incorporation, metallochaperone, hypA
MHEEALVHDLRRKIDELAAAHGHAAIVRARVAVGELSHLDERRLRELWSRAMADGPAANAALEVELLSGIDHPQASSVVLRSVTFEEPDRTAPARRAVPTRSSSRGA